MFVLSWSFKLLGITNWVAELNAPPTYKEGEISRLMDEIHQLKDSVDSQRLVLDESQAQNLSLRQCCQDMEMSLAARSAAQPVDQVRSDAPPPPAFSAQLLSMMEALQDLSTRMSAVEDAQEIHVDQVQSRNSAAVSFPFPPSNLPPRPLSFPALAGSGGPVFPSNDGGDGFDDADEELVRDRMPQSSTSHRDLAERDIVDDRSLRYATAGPVPSSASEFRAWKNQLFLIIAKLDIRDRDYLAHWLSKAYEVNSDEAIKHDSGCVPRLDRWLAAEISKGCENVPELQFKIMGYIEGCTRIGNPPRGRYLLHIVSRHFVIDRTRGSLLTSQSIFQIGLDGYSAKHICKSFQVVSFALWIVCRGKIGHLSAWWVSGSFISWGKFASWKGPSMRSREAILSRHSMILIIFGIGCRNLLEERENINAQSIKNLLKSSLPKKLQPDKPTSAPAAIAPSSESKTSPKGSQGKGKSNDSRAKGQNSVHLPYSRMPAGCVHGDKCQCLHEPAPSRSWGSGGFHPSNCQQIPWSLCCAELSWIGVLWFADSPGCFWIFSWKAFSFLFFSVLFLPIAGRFNEVCAVPSLVGLEFCALPILFAAFGFLPVSFVIVSFQHFVKASVVAWSLDFIC